MQCSNSLLSKRIAEREISEKSHKAAAWERIKSESPEIADFLSDVSRIFGKPSRVNVYIKGEKII